ncbi:MAG: roadblock/LC7 domain-containing protein [Anaerolineaceae bacterium]|nr:roadblock/LC7 domain-containing protein [Anaerolineaceae bacterium]
MEWFERLANNSHIQLIVVANNRGQLLRASSSLNSSNERLASMFQALFVLAQNMISDFNHNPAQFILLSTNEHHVLIFAPYYPTYYVAIVVGRTAPLSLLMTELERVLSVLTLADLEALDTALKDNDLDAAELIQAVQEWLWEKPTGNY